MQLLTFLASNYLLLNIYICALQLDFFVNFPFKIIYNEFKSLQHQKSKKGRFYSCS
jgi:hypothetical protein